MSEQVTINSLEFAEKSLEIHGTIAPLELSGLADMLHSGSGELHYQLKGGINARGLPVLVLNVSGVLNLICQRCLGAVEFPVDTVSRFVIVADEDSLPAPDEERDDEDYLVADPHLAIHALVEEEVLLELPLAPKHDAENCAGTDVSVHEQKESPFKLLQGLKLNKG